MSRGQCLGSSLVLDKDDDSPCQVSSSRQARNHLTLGMDSSRISVILTSSAGKP